MRSSRLPVVLLVSQSWLAVGLLHVIATAIVAAVALRMNGFIHKMKGCGRSTQTSADRRNSNTATRQQGHVHQLQVTVPERTSAS